jgi:hypothetical protein
MEHIHVFVSPGETAAHTSGQSAVYACRNCRDAVKVAAIRYLPETCPSCASSTWDEERRCGNWERCTAVRRQGIRGRSHCHSCGYSIWVLVGVEETSRLLSGAG